MRFASIIVVATFASSLAACAAPTTDEAPAEASSEELVTNPPSKACGAIARKAVAAVEQVNGAKVKITRVELVDGFSDRELVRVSVKRNGEKDSYLVSTESMGGAPCYAYGLQRRSQEIALVDDGKVLGAASTECAAVANAAVNALENANGGAVSLEKTERADGFSDRELVRVRFGKGTTHDSYLVNTESMGGAPCYVYGLQLKSEEMSLLED